jgi:hypothetical protein
MTLHYALSGTPRISRSKGPLISSQFTHKHKSRRGFFPVAFISPLIPTTSEPLTHSPPLGFGKLVTLLSLGCDFKVAERYTHHSSNHLYSALSEGQDNNGLCKTCTLGLHFVTMSEIGNHEHSALVLAEGYRDGYISKPVFFIYPYVFVAEPNKHDVLLVSRAPTDCEILTHHSQSSRLSCRDASCVAVH